MATHVLPAAAARPRGLERREQRWALLNVSPAAALIFALLAVPLLWLFALSFTGPQGGFTLDNYARIFDDTSYARAFYLTAWLAVVTTVVCALAGYVLAYAMTLMPRWAATLVMALVALPFWTSVLVRTYAWLVLLQNRGIVNTLLLKSGLIDTPIPMMHNAVGALVGMVHIMLPFMVFPLYAALQKVDPDHTRAAAGMGASPLYTFWHVFFPQTMAGIVAGCVLVFVLCLGFYITPALLGGGRTVVMSILIEHEVNSSMNWGTASAVAIFFVAAVLAIFAAAGRYMPVERLFQK
ncbi:ABC transporter permease [Variovorax terrae]|uniref:ABC transporter permease n=1 Tax=Variovorax terrae TaxID=2923278 RepID=A0A9X1W2E0_9BURK|nr:ABC transporter permease [Variovorax terrae]MCJ0764813.1 ABC transporter permease [Variovorax terrae]